MKFFLDTTKKQLVKSAASNVALDRLVLKRRDLLAVEVVFVARGAVASMPAGTTTTVALKRSFADSNFLALASGEPPILDLNTTPIEAIFSETNPASISALLEIRWAIPGETTRNATLAVELQNSVILGNEQTPQALPDGKATQEQAEAGTDNETWMTPLRTAQAIAELAPPPTWDSVTGKPATFPATAHTHLKSEITGLNADLAALASADTALGQRIDYIAANLDPAALDSISEAAASINSLQSQLDNHTHSAADITDFASAVVAVSPPVDWSSLTGKPTTFAPEAHTHSIADVTGLAEAINSKATAAQGAKADTASQPGHGHVIDDVSGLQAALDGKSSATHKSTHATGGSDPITPSDIGAEPVFLLQNVSANINDIGPKTVNAGRRISVAFSSYLPTSSPILILPRQSDGRQIGDIIRLRVGIQSPNQTPLFVKFYYYDQNLINIFEFPNGVINGSVLELVATESGWSVKNPTNHAALHATGGPDAITPSSIGAAAAAHTHAASEIAGLSSFIVASAPSLSISSTIQVADGTSVTFPIDGLVSNNPEHVIVALNGVTQAPGTDYSVSEASGTITFDAPPTEGMQIACTVLGLRTVQPPIDPTLYLFAFDSSLDGLTTYSGRLLNADRPAAPALPETATTWTIKRSTLSDAGRVLATASATGSWANRETLAYS